MPHTIRPVTRDDLPQLLGMIARLAAHHGDEPAASLDQLARDTLGPHPWFHVLVAETGAGTLCGYAAMLPLGQLQNGARGMDMHHLFVNAQVRGSGVGTTLTQACVAFAREQGCVVLTVGTHPENPAAAAFYQTRGFTPRTSDGLRFTIRLDQPPT